MQGSNFQQIGANFCQSAGFINILVYYISMYTYFYFLTEIGGQWTEGESN